MSEKNRFIYFSFTLFILTIVDIITTHYAISNFGLSEGNPIMAYFTSSLLLFIIIKMIGIMLICGLYRMIQTRSPSAAKIGQAIIIFMMLAVVGNNTIQIASATVSYQLDTPNSMSYPGRVEYDTSLSYQWLIANGTYLWAFGIPETNGSLGYSKAIRVTSGYGGASIIYGMLGWANPFNVVFVDSLKNVLIGTSPTPMNYNTTGYKEYGANPDSCPSCDQIYKIGILTDLNPKISGYTDLDGNIYVSELNRIVKFTKSADYSKTTYITMPTTDQPTCSAYVSVTSCTRTISDISFDINNNMYILYSSVVQTDGIAGTDTYGDAGTSLYIFSGTTLLYSKKDIITDHCVSRGYPPYSCSVGAGSKSALLPSTDRTNISNMILASSGYESNQVLLRFWNGSSFSDICVGACASITNLNGIGYYNNYIFIPSTQQGYIYRFPTSIAISIGTGYVPGAGATAAQGELQYTTKSIASRYSTYYNNSNIILDYNIKTPSGIGSGQNLTSYNYFWNVVLIDPNGAMAKTTSTQPCLAGWFTSSCEIGGSLEYQKPISGWLPGAWTARLYENNRDTGKSALIAISSPFTISSNMSNMTQIQNPVEPITSASNQKTISEIDQWVLLFFKEINGVSKFLFSIIIITMLAIVAMIFSKNGNITAMVVFGAYIGFTYLEYIPKWIFVMVVILVAVYAKIFR